MPKSQNLSTDYAVLGSLVLGFRLSALGFRFLVLHFIGFAPPTPAHTPMRSRKAAHHSAGHCASGCCGPCESEPPVTSRARRWATSR